MLARGDHSAAFATSAQDGDTTPFADLLGTPPEHLPDGTPAPVPAKPQPRDLPADGTDPALALLLPFMLTQLTHTLPTPPAVPGGFALNAGAGDCVSGVFSGASASEAVPSKGALPQAAVLDATTVVVTGDGANGTAFPKDAVANTASLGPQPDGARTTSANRKPPLPVSVAVQPDAKRTEAEPAADFIFPTTITKIIVMTESAPIAQPSPAGISESAASAESSRLPDAAVASPVLPTAFSESRNGISQRETQSVSETASAGEAGGTMAAMQRLTMKAQSSERQTRTAANVAVIPSAPGKQRAAGMPEKSSGTRVSESAQTVPMTPGITFELQEGRGQVGEALEAGEPTAASEITRQTFDLIERIRVTGREHAEVRMILNDGQQVTVSLRIERGEWKPVFKTESEALCRALEQSWNRAVAQPAPQSVKFGTPVFESHSAQSDFGGNSQQQSESGGRGRPFDRREREPAFENVVPFPAAAKPTRAAHVSRFSEAAAMHVYA